MNIPRFCFIPLKLEFSGEIARGGVLENVLGLEDVLDAFEVFGLGLEASSPRKLACPRLEDSTIFWIVKILWSAWKNFWKNFFLEIAWKKFLKIFFFSFFREHLRLSPWYWPRPFLSLASRGSVLGRPVLGLGLRFFLYPWPWLRALCPRLHLWKYPLSFLF